MHYFQYIHFLFVKFGRVEVTISFLIIMHFIIFIICSRNFQSMFEKSFLQHARRNLRYILPSFSCRSPLRRLHSGEISRKLRRTSCRKHFSNTLQKKSVIQLPSFFTLQESSIFGESLNENSPHRGGHTDRTTPIQKI